MPIIFLTTEINAPIKRCFDLSRSIDLHMLSTSRTNEKAIEGRTKGLVEEGDTVTWEATHLGIRQKLGSKISVVRSPDYFTDEMIFGAFKRFHHEHIFEEKDGKTMMTDKFDYTSPLGIIGKMVDIMFLTAYMKRFLTERNALIKEFAETERWKELPGMIENSQII
jgi:ligand-binding SRPBCC domain-containing protein